MLFQIKIWFQNRRTKWKRKYTSDVETLASQYYAQIGIGSLARPMVVGDRLWLFSQTPSASHPILNSNSGVPLHPVNTAIRGFAAPQPMPPPPLSAAASSSSLAAASLLENSRNNYFACNQAMNFCAAKPAPFLQRVPPHLKPYESLLPVKYQDPLNRNFSDLSSASNGLMPKDPLNKLVSNQNPNYRESLMGNYLDLENMKFTQNSSAFALASSSSRMETDQLSSNDSGITELERAFGNTNRCNQLLLNSETKCSKRIKNEPNLKDNGEVDNCSTDNSDVDCEEIDDT